MWKPWKRSVPADSSPPVDSKPKLKRTGNIDLGLRKRGLFAAADNDRNNSNWDKAPQPIGQVIDQKQSVLVARSRERISNDDYARGFVREVRKNVLGHKGITLQVRALDATGQLDVRGNAAVENGFKKWGRRRSCTVDGRLDWVRLKRVIINTVVGSGEIFIRYIEGADAGPWGFSLQILDPLRVPVGVNDLRLGNGNVIRNGIEMTMAGRPVAYLVEVKAGVLSDAYRYGGKEFERVPAADIEHIFDQEHPEQYRGLPWNHTSLTRMRNLGGFEEAALVNARAGASKTMVLKADPDVYDVEDEDGNYEEPDVELEANSVVVLPPGYEPVNYSPEFPAASVGALSKHMLRGVSTGSGVSYNTLSNDLEGVNFSSIRQGKLDERDGWLDLQEWFIEAMCTPIYEKWLAYSLLSGRIVGASGKPVSAIHFDKYTEVLWQARRWDWVDPVKAEKGITEAVSHMRKSTGEAIRESGRDPVDVWKGYASDIKSMKEQGIPEEMINSILGINAPQEEVDDESE